MTLPEIDLTQPDAVRRELIDDDRAVREAFAQHLGASWTIWPRFSLVASVSFQRWSARQTAQGQRRRRTCQASFPARSTTS